MTRPWRRSPMVSRRSLSLHRRREPTVHDEGKGSKEMDLFSLRRMNSRLWSWVGSEDGRGFSADTLDVGCILPNTWNLQNRCSGNELDLH